MAVFGLLQTRTLAEVVRRVARKLLCEFVGKGDIVRLERALVGRVRVRQHDHGEGVAGGGEGGVIDACNPCSKRYREARRHVLDLEVVQHNRLQVALGVGRAVQRGELLLLEDRLQRIRRRLPRALRLGEAEVVEGGADRDDQVALERVVRGRNTVRVALAKRRIGGRSLAQDGCGISALSLWLVSTDGHRCVWSVWNCRLSSDCRVWPCPYQGDRSVDAMF